MDINALAGAQTQSASGASRMGLADNFETFLTLLTAQLKNQDPLEPMDSGEFTSQLVQFTSVEQSIATNQHLENLVSLTTASSANAAVSYLGKEVTAEGITSRLSEGEANWAYELARPAGQTTLTVTDFAGRPVFTTSGDTADGSHTFTWDGRDSSGYPLPDGSYNLQVRAKDTLGNDITTKTQVTGTVRSVAFDDGLPILDIDGVRVQLKDVLEIVDKIGTGA